MSLEPAVRPSCAGDGEEPPPEGGRAACAPLPPPAMDRAEPRQGEDGK